jgi:hypothetical protein
VIVLVFLRPIEEIVYGKYSQLMKQNMKSYWESRDPYGGDFDHFLKQQAGQLRLTLQLKRWKKELDGARFEIYPHHEISAVLERILPVTLDGDVPQYKTNKSLRVSDCELMVDKFRNSAMTWNEVIELRQQAQKDAHLGDVGRSKERRKMIRATFRDEIVRMNRTFAFGI